MEFDVNQFRVYLSFSMIFGMLSLETFFAVRPWENNRITRFVFHILISATNGILTRLVCATPLLLWIDFVNKKQFGLSHVIGIEGIPKIIGTIILFDMFDYWWHRINHEVPFLWKFHRYHHMDTHVDLATSLRFHPGELFFSYLTKATWIIIWGPSLIGFALFEAGIAAYSMFHHSNIDFPDRIEYPLRYLHTTPRVHASHHTVSTRTRNGNYSTIFLWWDYLFGTFHKPDYSEMKSLGLKEGRRDYMTWQAYLLSPFKTIQ